MNQAETARIVMAAKYAGLNVVAEDEELLTRVWAGILADVPYRDAAQAVIDLAQSGDFLDPHAIRSHVKRARARRLDEASFGTLAPNADPDDPVAWVHELRALRDAIADGMTPDALAAYRAGGTSLTGSHEALALPAAPADPAEVQAGRAALAAIRTALPTPSSKETP